MNSYNLSRLWFSFAYNNPKVRPVHTALYFWIIERANTSGWKLLIDIQTEKSMECLGITDWRTYKNALQFLVDSGFIKWLEKSRNQFTCNRITLVENPSFLVDSAKNSLASIAEANAPNAEAIAEAIAEAYAEAHVEAIAEALQSYINLKTFKPLNLKTKKQAAPGLFKEDNPILLPEKKEKATHTGAAPEYHPLLLFHTPEFNQTFQEFLVFRKQKKVPVLEASYKQFFQKLKKLSNCKEDIAIEILNQSIANGWQGLFPLKNENQNYNGTPSNNSGSNQSSRKPSGAELAYAIAS